MLDTIGQYNYRRYPIITSLLARHFAEFDLETLEYFCAAAQEVLRLVEKRSRS